MILYQKKNPKNRNEQNKLNPGQTKTKEIGREYKLEKKRPD